MHLSSCLSSYFWIYNLHLSSFFEWNTETRACNESNFIKFCRMRMTFSYIKYIRYAHNFNYFIMHSFSYMLNAHAPHNYLPFKVFEQMSPKIKRNVESVAYLWGNWCCFLPYNTKTNVQREQIRTNGRNECSISSTNTSNKYILSINSFPFLFVWRRMSSARWTILTNKNT